MIQGSDDWRFARCGRLTASRVHEALSKLKNGNWSAASRDVMHELLAERLTGIPADHFTSAAMRWGTAHEADAALAYEFYADRDVAEVGFVPHPTIDWSGASPDRLVGDDGLIEIKCPTTETHVDTLISGLIPTEYVSQIHWQLACTGRAWCDFVSYDPRMPAHRQIFVRRIERDEAIVAAMEADASKWLAALADKVERLMQADPTAEPERVAA